MKNKDMEKENETKTVVPALRFPEFRECESWDKKNIDSILDCDSSQLVLSKLNFVNDGYPVYGADGIIGYIPNYKKDQVYISIVKDGSGVGRLNICSAYSSLLGTLNYLVSKNEQEYKIRWIYYLLQTIDFSNYIKGSGIPHIYFNDYKKQKIYISCPLEQQKIVDCLSSLDELIKATNRKIEALKEHKKGLMQRLFPKDGEDVPELRFPEFQGTKGWEKKKMGEIGLFYGGGTPDRSHSSYWTGNIGWISSSDLMEDDIHHISITRFINDEAINKSATKVIPKGCVLFVSRVGVGKIAVNTERLCTSQDFTNFQPFKEVSSYFVGYYFLCKKENLRLYNQGTSIKGFSKSDLEKTEIVFPLDIKEQQKIANCLSSLDELIEATSQKVEILKEHKKGLMQQLFPKI